MTSKTLTLAIEGLSATEGPTDGAGRYLTTLLTAVGQRTDVRTIAYVHPSMRVVVSGIEGLDRVFVVPARTRALRICAQHIFIPVLSALHKADVVLYTGNYLSILSLRPSIAVVQNMFLAHPTEAEGRARAIYRATMRSIIAQRAQAVVAVSSVMAREFERRSPKMKSRIHVIHPAVDTEFFQAETHTDGAGSAYFLLVGTVWSYRNFDLAIRALVLSELPHRLCIAGATPRGETHRLQRLAEALGIDHRVEFLGVVHPKDMPGWYAKATAVVSTSSFESFGLSIIEAMAAGAPIIAVRRTVYPETVGTAGLLVAPTPEELAQAMVHVTHPDVRFKLISKGKARARSFSPSRFADQLIQVCRSVTPQ